jgi:hypothetical protein
VGQGQFLRRRRMARAGAQNATASPPVRQHGLRLRPEAASDRTIAASVTWRRSLPSSVQVKRSVSRVSL